MFALEMVGGRPAGVASYYTVCVREPVTVGRLESCDISFNDKEISRQHATFTVSVPEDAPVCRQKKQSNGAGSLREAVDDGTTNPAHVGLVLTLTNFSQFGTVVNDNVQVTGSCTLHTGDTVSFGGGIALKVKYRPVVVSIAQHCYSPEYIEELTKLMTNAGAAVVDSPMAIVSEELDLGAAPGVPPVALFYCTEELDDHKDSLAALVFGFSAVVPSFVFEFFGSLADIPSAPLHRLPPPTDFSAAVNKRAFPRYQYLRPEPDGCPFSLFPQPQGAGINRSRANLFLGRKFYICDVILRNAIGMFIAACNGKVRPRVEMLDLTTTHTAPLCYLVISDTDFDHYCQSGVASLPTNVTAALKENYKVICQRDILACLLTNEFRIQPLQLSEEELHALESPNPSFGNFPGGDQSFALRSADSTSQMGSAGTGTGPAAARRRASAARDPRSDLPSSFTAAKPRAMGSFYSPTHKNRSPQQAHFGDALLGSATDSPSQGPVSLKEASFGGPAMITSGSSFHLSGVYPQPTSNPSGAFSGYFVKEPSVDSDATPSELDDDYKYGENAAKLFTPDDDEGNAMAEESPARPPLPRYSDGPIDIDEGVNPVVAAIQQLKQQQQRVFVPAFVRVDDIYAAAKKNRYVAASSIAFLEDTYGKCEQHIAALEEFSTSPEGNRRSKGLRQQWDECEKLQDKIIGTMQLASSIGDQQAKHSRLLRNRNPHKVPARALEEREDAGVGVLITEPSAGSPPAPAPAPGPQLLTPGKTNSPEQRSPRASGQAGTPEKNKKAGSTSAAPPVDVKIRQGTQVARYHPLPPTKGRLHVCTPKTTTYESGDLDNAKFNIHIPANASEDVANHRKLFMRKYGGPEGEIRFGMWFSSQSVEWNKHFYRGLEAKNMTMAELLGTTDHTAQLAVDNYSPFD